MKRVLPMAAALVFMPAAASAASGSSFGINLQIPVVCELDAPDLTIQPDQEFASGYAFESCNTQDGFMVMASHRPLEDGEQVEFNYAGQASMLSRAGSSVVATRRGAKHGQRMISVRQSQLREPLVLTLGATTL